MDFRQLETFVAIAKLKSFSKAGDYLYLTQPTISNHIQNLEQELGTLLINRSNKKITLTKAGEIFFAHAMDIINKREQALFSLESFKGKIEGTLEIACSTIPEQYVLPKIIQSFNQLHPDVRYRLFHYDSQQVIDGILDGGIDFGFVGAKDEIKQLDYIEIMDDKLVFIAPYLDQYIPLDKVSFEFIVNQNIILREKGSGSRRIFEQLLLDHHISIDNIHVVACLENTEAIKQCVRNGLGITLISELAILDEVKYNLVKKIELEHFEIIRKFYFVCHRNRTLSPLTEAFKNFILNNKPV